MVISMTLQTPLGITSMLYFYSTLFLFKILLAEDLLCIPFDKRKYLS